MHAILSFPVVAALVLGPLVGSGYLHFLDWSPGPQPRLELWPAGPARVIPGLPLGLLLAGLQTALSGPAMQRLVLGGVLLLAGVGGYRLVPSSVGVARMAGGLLYMVNPFLYERLLAGQVGLAVSYSLMPHAMCSLRGHLQRSTGRSAVVLALWAWALVAGDSHYIFVLAVVLGVVLAVGAARRRWGSLGGLALAAGAWLGLSAYWILPNLSGASELARVSGLDLELFRTRADPGVGLLPTALGLYGFWRRDWPLPREGLAGWPLLLGAMLVVVGVGLRATLRKREQVLAVVVGLSGAGGLLLALGDQGPTGSIFLWMFQHLPGFRIMREPQKFLALLALAYAFFYGLGAERVVTGARSRWARALMAALLLALPIVHGYKMLWGFNGYVKPSRYPVSWAGADRIMGEGPEKLLALPWHLYVAFPWTQGRVVANPMASYFRRGVIVGDNIELGPLRSQSADPRSRYLEFLHANGRSVRRFGNLVAPLGVRYVLLAKVGDWRKYLWLYEQEDLRLVREWSDLALFENREPALQVYAPAGAVEVENWGQLPSLAEGVRLTDLAVGVRHPRPGPLRPAPPVPAAGSGEPVEARRQSAVRHELEEAPAGPLVVLAEPYHRGWAYRGVRAAPNLGVTNLFDLRTDPGRERPPGTIEFLGWRRAAAGYATSLVALLAVACRLALGGRALRSRRDALDKRQR